MGTPAGDVTQLLLRLREGDADALARLVPLVYKELRRLAGHFIRGERPGHTLQPTALVNEVYLRLIGQTRAEWQSRAQFVAVAAQMMRRILVNYALQRKAGKRTLPVTIELNGLGRGAVEYRLEEVLAVDEALGRLAALDPRQARAVEMRYFGGLTEDEIAEALHVSPRTVRRELVTARLWLHAELSEGAKHDSRAVGPR
jgi:RNA polymerase sigma factor (TIGR02999 family)